MESSVPGRQNVGGREGQGADLSWPLLDASTWWLHLPRGQMGDGDLEQSLWEEEGGRVHLPAALHCPHPHYHHTETSGLSTWVLRCHGLQHQERRPSAGGSGIRIALSG